MFTRKENHIPPLFYDVPSFDSDIVEVPTLGAFPNSVRIVHRGQLTAGQIRLRISFNQTGVIPASSGWAAGCHYHVRPYLELMGPGDGPALPNLLIPIIQGAPLVTYDLNNVPALDMVLPANLPDGVYRVVNTIWFVLPGHGGNILHGFDDSIGMFQVSEGAHL